MLGAISAQMFVVIVFMAVAAVALLPSGWASPHLSFDALLVRVRHYWGQPSFEWLHHRQSHTKGFSGGFQHRFMQLREGDPHTIKRVERRRMIRIF
jgi:hypothetical protein